MGSGAFIAQLERRLVEQGFTGGLIRREVRELADHHDDLKQAALEEGLSEAEAEARADARLGEPVVLAELLAAALRQSSWWGRHPIIGFCLLPPVAILLLLFIGLGLDCLVGSHYFTQEQLSALVGTSADMHFFMVSFQVTYYAAITLTALLFSVLARRTGAWLKWALISCAMCLLNGMFFHVTLSPHNFSLGYGSNPDWFCPPISLLVALAVCAKHWRAKNSLPPLPVGDHCWRAANADAIGAYRRAHFPRSGWLKPSSAVAAMVLAVLVSAGLGVRADIRRQAKRVVELRTKVWPAESAAERKRIAARQSAKDTLRETTIDLSPLVNAALSESLNPKPGFPDDSLMELSQGKNIFGGVPFDVQGRIQLLGRGMIGGHKKYPAHARNIAIGRPCENIYLLHGAAFGNAETGPVPVARLVFHYADGSLAEININAGEHVRNWWGPLYTTGVTGEPRNALAPGTELAWAGSNARIRREQPEKSLRLYKTTFANPHPELEIASLDFISTVTDAAPFLLGLTVE